MPLAARTNRGSTFTKRNKMNSKKFLDQLGLIALISKIKQALNGKQDADMVVTITQSCNAYSCDTSIANIVAAHDAGRDVYAMLPPVSDGSSTKIKLVDVQNYGSGTVMMVSFGDIINNGTNNVLYSVSGTRQNNLDAWSVSQKTMQEKLVSGTSIKTVNGNTLLGSGDVTINGSERVAATWNASTSAYVSGASVDDMYQSFYTDGKVLELHLVNGSYNGMVLTCHGGYTDGSVRHMKFSGVTDDWIVSCDVVGTVVTVTYTSLFDIYEELNGKQDTIGLNNKVDADYVEYRGADTSRLGNGDSMTEALQTLDTAITNLGTPNEIASITTQESSASGGNNVVTITDTDGTSTSFNVKNGKDGKDGADGADGVSLGEIALVQTTGDATDEVMSQKAVSDRIERLTTEDLEQSIAVKRLPEGYEMLDYIINGTTTGSCAAIDTGLVPNDDDWQFKGSWARNGNIGNYGRIIESYFSEATYCYRLAASGTSVAAIIANAYSKSGNASVVQMQDSSIDVWHTYDLSYGKLVLDGVEHVINTASASENANTLKIGHVNYPQKTRVFKAYHNGELVAYMVPCKHGDDVGMYDLVREQFYTSSNANTFSAGGVVVEPADKLLDGEHLAGMIEQQTGNSDFKLMSQQAITNNIQRLDIDTLYSTTSQLKELLTAKGWMIGRIFTNTGYFTDNANYCISPLIPFQDMRGVSITIDRGGTLNTYPFTTYAEDGKTRKYGYNTTQRVVTTSNTDASYDTAFYIRLCLNLENIRSCYMLNNDTGEYIIKMDDYIKGLLDESSYLLDHKVFDRMITQETGDNKVLLMSQDAITRELTINNESRPITYFHGVLANFLLEDYPEFDFRSADGISVVLAIDAYSSSRLAMLGITNSSSAANNGFGGTYFALWTSWGSYEIGKLSSYGNLGTGGYNFGSSSTFRHVVITYDFNTGESKLYVHGVLKATKTTDDFDRQTIIQDYFDTCTSLYVSTPSNGTNGSIQKTSGIAVFGSVLTEEDVADLYGNGSDSIKNSLIPFKWKANHLHPINLTNWTLFRQVGTSTTESDGSYTLTPASGGASIVFGFVGINNVVGNLIYEWDFEVTSGTCTKTTNRADRRMQYNGNYHNVYIITDASGNDVTDEVLTTGVYHVRCKPDNVSHGGVNATNNQLIYSLYGLSEGFSMNIKPTLKITERGAALEFSLQTYKGLYWEQNNGIKLTTSPNIFYGTTNFGVGRDSFVSDTVIYKSNVQPQFNGQIAVDTTNGKVYVGYLTGTGGTWKQINNS